MRFTENYGLNLVEGSDIVNPLIQDVPNYEKIDLVLKDNENAGISSASELLTGTVHALTRDKQGAPMFRFIATSKYSTGDTFTVDGMQVTALTTTGEPLASGAYIIGSNVLCCLTGTLLTLFVGVGGEFKSYDSERLGGKEASEYATSAQVSDARNVAQAANDIALNNQSAIAKNVASIIDVNDIGLHYKSSGVMSGEHNIEHLGIEDYNNAFVLLTCKGVSQTPFTSVTNLDYKFNQQTHTLTVEAMGSGFVNGHMLAITYAIFCRK